MSMRRNTGTIFETIIQFFLIFVTKSHTRVAYDAAITMSTKLESAIDAMVLSVSDRLEREKIDKLTVEREADALERVNEERAYAARLAQRENDRQSNEVRRSIVTYQTVKVIQSKQSKRKELDFALPIYEEDESHRERSKGEAERQQQLFDAIEKQQRLHIRMQRISHNVGAEVYNRMLERSEILKLIEIKCRKQISQDATQSVSRETQEKKLHLIPNMVCDTKSSTSMARDVGRSKVVVSIGLSRKVKKRKKKSNLILEEFQ